MIGRIENFYCDTFNRNSNRSGLLATFGVLPVTMADVLESYVQIPSQSGFLQTSYLTDPMKRSYWPWPTLRIHVRMIQHSFKQWDCAVIRGSKGLWVWWNLSTLPWPQLRLFALLISHTLTLKDCIRYQCCLVRRRWTSCPNALCLGRYVLAMLRR